MEELLQALRDIQAEVEEKSATSETVTESFQGAEENLQEAYELLRIAQKAANA